MAQNPFDSMEGRSKFLTPLFTPTSGLQNPGSPLPRFKGPEKPRLAMPMSFSRLFFISCGSTRPTRALLRCPAYIPNHSSFQQTYIAIITGLLLALISDNRITGKGNGRCVLLLVRKAGSARALGVDPPKMMLTSSLPGTCPLFRKKKPVKSVAGYIDLETFAPTKNIPASWDLEICFYVFSV